MPVVLGSPPSGAVARFFGIQKSVRECKLAGTDIGERLSNMDRICSEARTELQDAMFEIGVIKHAVAQGALF